MLFALAQINPAAGALKKNAATIRRFYEEAQAAGAGLVIFPEMALAGGPPQDLLRYSSFTATAERLIRQELAPLTAASATAMLLGTAYRLEGELYNAVLLLEKGTVAAVYPKAALENRLPFREERYFSPGGRSAYERWGELAMAVVTGESILQPGRGKALLRRRPKEKQLLLVNPVASPYRYRCQKQREKAAAALSKKRRSALLVVNLVGGSGEFVFDGASLAFNNRGELLHRAASFGEEIAYLPGDALFAPAAEQHPAAGEGIATLNEALSLGIRDYFSKNGFQKAVLGLSGGLDSAVTAALAAEALGPENVLGVLLPSPYSPPHSLEDARVLAKNLDIETQTVPITPFLHAYLEKLNRSGEPELDLAEENLQARIRGNILMLLANRERRLLLTTGNRSELAVGYCTLYGDMAGALAVLADLPKLTVYELAREINRRQGAVIPERTITKPPSAELRPDQLDEDSLPPYSILDPILQLYLDEALSDEEIVAEGYDAAVVSRVLTLVERAEHKRRQAAPALRVISGLNRRSTPLAYRHDG
ncbi:MAG: NAD+ synthase [Firmicutes bacterium]|nr:NAD+ synthase [Bacillota bacterium]